MVWLWSFMIVVGVIAGGNAAAAPSSGAMLVPQLAHVSPVLTTAVSPDGTRVVTADRGGTVAVWDAPTGALLRRLEAHTRSVYRVAFSVDGARVLTASADKTAVVWNPATGDVLHTLEGHSKPVSAAAFSPDGDRVATVSLDGTLRLWEAATGRAVQQVDAHDVGVTDVAYAADGTRLITTGRDGTAALWTPTGELQHRLVGHKGWVVDGSFSPDGTQVVTAGADRVVIVWSTTSGAQVHRFVGHDGSVTHASFSSDGRRVASASRDGTARIWDVTYGRLAHRLAGHEGEVSSATFSPDGTRLATAGVDGTATVWNVATGARLHTLSEAGHPVLGAVFSPDGTWLVTSREDGAADVWDPASGERLRELDGNESAVRSVAYTPDGSRVVTSRDDGTAIVWDLGRGLLHHRLRGHEGPVNEAAVSPDGTRVVTASDDHTAVMWDLESGTPLQAFDGHTGPVRAARFSPDGSRVVTASKDGAAGLWDTATGARVHWLDDHGKDVKEATFSPDGSRVATASRDGSAALWDAATGARLHWLHGHDNTVNTARFSPDGGRVVTASLDGTAKVWDAGTGELLYTLAGHDGFVFTAEFTPDGTHVLTVGRDGRIGMFGTRKGRLIRWLSGDGYLLISAHVSPDGTRLVSHHEDGTAAVWNLDDGTQVARLQHPGVQVRRARLAPDGQTVATANHDGTAALWDAATGELLVSIMAFRDGSWATVDPAGRFDTSNGGEGVPGAVWVIDDRPYRLGQFNDRYYDPGLLRKRVLARAELRRVPSLDTVKPPARVRLKGPSETGQLELQLEDRGGGIGAVFATLNGKDISDALGRACADLSTGAPCGTNLASLDVPAWEAGAANQLQIRVGNRDNNVKGAFQMVRVVADGEPPADPPSLWVLAVGTGEYTDDALDLTYAGTDAVSLGKALAIAGEHGFGAERTHVRVLSTDVSDEVAGRPSIDALRDAFEWLAGAQQRDTVVVFLSGHGKALEDDAGELVYYYLLPDTASFADVRDPELRALRTFSSTELADALIKVPARKQVVVLDTCEAGAVDAALGATREVSRDALRAHELARDRTGAWLLAGAAADRPSFEATRYGQGVLTYSLLEAMRGGALDADQLTVSRWFEYAQNVVPTYAKGVGGVQIPYLRRGNDPFPVGAVPPDARSEVPIGNARAVVVKPLISEARRGDRMGPDRARVGALLTARLRDEARQPSASMVYFDAEAFDDSWQLVGTYDRSRKGLAFDGALFHGEDEFDITVRADDPEGLAETLSAQVLRRAR